MRHPPPTTSPDARDRRSAPSPPRRSRRSARLQSPARSGCGSCRWRSALPESCRSACSSWLRSSVNVGRRATPRRSRTCQSMDAIRSLITLIARRTTGVSANRRRFTGVGLGSSFLETAPGSRSQACASVLRSAFRVHRDPPPARHERPPRLLPHLPQLFSHFHAHHSSQKQGTRGRGTKGTRNPSRSIRPLGRKQNG